MKTELLAEKTALVMQNKNGGFRDLYGSLSTVQWRDATVCTVTLPLVAPHRGLDHLQPELGVVAGQLHLVGKLAEDPGHVLRVQLPLGVAVPGERHVDQGLALDLERHRRVTPHLDRVRHRFGIE